MVLPALRAARSTDALCAVLLGALAVRIAAPGVWASARVQAWCTVFGALCLQAGPYIVLGVVLASAVSLVPARWLHRALPRRPVLAVPVAALGAAAIPGCECGSVPLAGTLMGQGIGVGPAVATMLSAPATNPVVLAATAAAFPGRPQYVLARFVASYAVAVLAGWACRSRAPDGVVASHGTPSRHEHPHRGAEVLFDAADDLARSVGLLVVGAAAAATTIVVLPQSTLDAMHGTTLGSTVALAALAVLAGVCSSADAFVAASFAGFCPSAQLAFMVVGPAVDVKLIAMQAGIFGVRFTAKLSAVSFTAAVGAALIVSGVLL